MRLGPSILSALALALGIALSSGSASADQVCDDVEVAANACLPEAPVLSDAVVADTETTILPPVLSDPDYGDDPLDPDVGDPDDPLNPVEPTEPVDPTDPTNPDDPGNPANPGLKPIAPRDARIQLYRNGLRGLAYVSTWQQDGRAEPAGIRMQPTMEIPLDGDGRENAWGNVYPIDVNGDGRYGFVHFNGNRLIRVFDAEGNKLWEERNPSGRIHRSPVHRDTMAVLDTDGDGRQEIVHCWVGPSGDGKVLMVRDGATGSVIRSTVLAGELSANECQIAAFPMQGVEKPIVMISRHAMPGTVCSTPYIDTWSRTTAFDLELNELWDRSTCAAGHYAWPLDEDADGNAEAVFVGKYLFDPAGNLRCTLSNVGTDHIDSMVVADLDPSAPGYELAAVGSTGVRFYEASTCRLRWSVHGSVIVLPQFATSARLTGSDEAPSVLITPKSRRKDPHLYRFSPNGLVVDRMPFAQLSQNANLDGATESEDLVGPYGQVLSMGGGYRLTARWYWDLQELTPEEERLPAADQWAWQPVVFDFDHDGRDEMIVWGRHMLVVGKAL